MLGEKIKKYREEKKMTQVEVADVLGVKQLQYLNTRLEL